MHNFLLANSNYRGYVLLILFSLNLFIFPVTGYGQQCPNDNNFWTNIASIPCGVDGAVNVGAGTYVTFPVVTNGVYIFRTCGSTAIVGSTFDTQLSGYNNSGGAFAFYNDDANGLVLGTGATTALCTDPSSTGLESYVGWTSNFTGTLRVMVDVYNCNICTSTNCPALGSAVLRYRQSNNLSITSSNATLCSGQSVSLTATPAGGTFTGTGVLGSTFTAPVTAGSYTITYTLGSCSTTQDIAVNSLSVAPTSITGTTAICPGGNTTLTVSGGSLGSGAQWLWYSGSCGGTLVASGVSSINVSPLSATTYYVLAQGTCNTTTCASVTVTINPLSTDPTSILGTTTICSGGNTTLTVQGGSLGTGAQWFWYSGSCGGTFVASGTSSINVSPASATTYYVRAQGTCNTTNCASVTVNINTVSLAPGSVSATSTLICNGQNTTLTANGATLGTGGVLRWYSGSCGGTLEATGPSVVLSPTTTTTYYVRAEDPAPCNTLTSCASVTITVNQPSVAPSTISGNSVICTGGSTTLTVADGSLGTGANWQWYSNSCGGTFVGSGPSVTVSPVSNTTYYVRAEGSLPCAITTACASVLVTVNTQSSAPGSVSATTSLICNGQNTTLTANGATLGTGGVLTWYSGSCGGTFEGTGNPIIVSPTTNTTYYVRVEDPSPCNTITSCASTTITVNQPSVAPTGISGTSIICNGGSTTLTVVGGSLGTGANWQWYSNSCGGTIVGSGPSITVSPISSTTYYVRAEGSLPCATTTSCASFLVIVSTFSTSPTSVAGTTTVCEGNSTTLSVVGGALGAGATWQWYEGGCGINPSIGTGSSITVTPTIATDYYVRAEGPCDSTSCTFTTVSVNDSSLPAASISGSPAICIGGSTNLTVAGGHLGVGASWKWYSASCGGTLAGTGALISVSPVITTTYYLRAEGLCNTTTCTSFTVTVNPLPNGNIGGSATICAGTVDTVLTFNFSVGTGPFDITFTDGTSTFSKTSVNNGDTVHMLLNSTTSFTFSQIQDANGCVRNSGFLGGATITFVPLPVITTVSVTDVLCNGGSTGTITVTASSGTPSYTYSIDGGNIFQSSNFFGGLPFGSYNLAVSDIYNCSSFYSANPVDINEPVVLDHTSVAEDASCANVFDGKITVTATGGVAPYNYSLNGGPSQLGNIFTGLAGGTYIVQVADFNGCTDTSHVLINNTYSLSDSIVSQTDVSCFGGLDGSVTVELSGGVTPYSYSINGLIFQSSPIFTSLASGNYVVTLRDSKGCTDFLSVLIAQPNLLQAIVDSVHNISCSGGNSGGIFISVLGGNGGYSFLWSNGDTNEDITGLAAGTYNVAITDSKGCSASAGATISQPLPLFLSVASYQDLLCFNDSSGEIDITVNGGVPQYTFAWSNGATNEDIVNLSSGTYSVTVNDANGCMDSLTQFIDEPTQLSTSIITTGISCAGGSGGSVDLSVSGGTPGYSYLWNNGTTTQDLTNVSGGNYSVVVYDANGCSATDITTVVEPSALNLTISVTNVLCHDSLTGALDLSVSGGAGGYSYLWNNTAITQDITGLGAGSYSVVVTDANSCTASASATVTQPAGMILNATTTIGCAGSSNGSIDITVQGGVFPYSYLWSTTATTEDINGLSSGTYDVTVTDANGCVITQSFTITSGTPIISSIVGTNVTCNGAANGAADLTVSGGAPPYTYLWSTFQNSEDISGLSGGTYYVIIKDVNGCEKRDSVIITEMLAMQLSTSVTNVLCHDSLTGAIDLSVSGGAGGYSYLWNTTEITEDIANLGAGNYSVVVTDANSCTASATATVTQPAGMILNTTTTVGCAGSNNGSVDITVQGGVFPYSYLWSNGAITEDINGLGAGTYDVTVTDANGCTITQSFAISATTPLASSIVGTDVTCHGANDGAADLTVTGGTSPYTFLWSTFQNTEDLINLSGGIYYVIIKDATACEKRDSVIISEPLAIALNTSVTNVLCHDSLTGAVDLSVSNGAGNYTYLWSNSAITEDITDVGAGTYSVVVTDANSCTASTSAVVSQPTALQVTASITNVLCVGNNDGSVSLSVFGGTPIYSFLWNDGSTNQNIQNLPAGTVSVTVTDANGCSITGSYTVSAPSGAITSSVTGTNVLCNSSNTGSASVSVSGGSAPYLFLWSNFQATSTISGLSGGTYYVIITDANGCTKRDSIIISEPAPFVTSVSSTDITCHNADDGAIDLTVSGATLPYTYLWSNTDTTQDISGLAGGTYSVVITDLNNCTTSTSATIINPSSISINFVDHNPLCFQDLNGSIDLIPSGGTPNYSFAWSNTAITEDISGIGAGVYSVTVTDANGCIKTDSTVITQPSAFYVSGVIKHVSCFGYKDGAIDITAYGGTLPYNFNWSSGQSTEDLWFLSGGSDTVYVFDANGCQAVSIYVVNEPQQLTISLTATNVSCFSGSDGSVAVIPGGGKTPYRYLWDDFVTDSSRNAIAAARYIVMLTDSNGCFVFDSVNITQPTEINISGVVTDAACSGANTGAINITVTGGTPGYTFAWTGGAVTEDLTSIAAGTYTVTVTDANGCTKVDSFVVKESTTLFTSVSINNPTCSGGNTGFILIDVTGGVAPYTYTWNTPLPNAGPTATNLVAGTYTVTVQDAHNCSASASAELLDPAPIVVTASVKGANCFNTTAVVTAGVTGGVPPYTYLLNGVAKDTTIFTGLSPGTYMLLVIDVNGCQGKVSFDVISPAPISANLSATQQVILTGMETQLIVTTDSVSRILHYYWIPDSLFGLNSCTDCSNPFVAPRTTTIFTVTVMSTDSCFASDTITIYVNNEASKFIPTAFTPNGDGLNDRFEFDVLGAIKLDVSIYNRWGEKVYSNPDQKNGTNSGTGWDGTKDGKPVPFDTYVYRINVTYWDDAIKEVTGTVTLMK